MTKRFAKSFQLYKPRKDNTGMASSWSFELEKGSVFLEFSRQKTDGSGEFDWQNKCVMKLGIPDLGEILSVLNRYQNGVGPLNTDNKRKGLYHQNTKGNTILTFQKLDKKDIFGIRLSQRMGNNPVRQFQHLITFGEAEILKIFVQRCVEKLYDETYENKKN